MFTAMQRGDARTPSRFWERRVAETEKEVSDLLNEGFVKVNIELPTLNSALSWIRS